MEDFEKEKREALEFAVKRLGERDYSAKELTDKLRRKGFSAEAADSVIARLKDSGAVNDVRYAKAALATLFGKNRSRSGAARALSERGVSGGDIETAFREYDEEEGIPDEHELARRETEKVLREAGISSSEPVPEKILGRAARRLSSRGFPASVIYDLISEYRKSGDDSLSGYQ